MELPLPQLVQQLDSPSPLSGEGDRGCLLQGRKIPEFGVFSFPGNSQGKV